MHHNQARRIRQQLRFILRRHGLSLRWRLPEARWLIHQQRIVCRLLVELNQMKISL